MNKKKKVDKKLKEKEIILISNILLKMKIIKMMRLMKLKKKVNNKDTFLFLSGNVVYGKKIIILDYDEYEYEG